MWLVVGLGNPGPEYEGTYHNVGFRVVQAMADQHHVRIRQECGPATLSDKITLGGQTAVLVQPQTFMNRSGLALPKLFERFEAAIQDIVVVYDDLALPLGKLRVRQKGSAGGHNGLKSLIAHLGSEDFTRLRLGIGLPPKKKETIDFVLEKFTPQEKKGLDVFIQDAVDCCVAWLTGNSSQVMSQFNRKKST